MRDWTDKNGNKRRNAEVIADHVYFGDSPKAADTAAAPQFEQFDNDMLFVFIGIYLDGVLLASYIWSWLFFMHFGKCQLLSLLPSSSLSSFEGSVTRM